MIFDVISVAVIPFLIQLLKKIKLPKKLAPIAALVLAVIIVAGGNALGLDLNVESTFDIILKGLGIAGVSVLGYDITKKLTGK